MSAGQLAAPPGPPVPGDQKENGANGKQNGGAAGAPARVPYQKPGLCTKCWRKLCPFCCAPSLAEMQKEKEREQRAAAKRQQQEGALAMIKKEEKPRPTKFYYKIDKISATFEQQYSNVCFEFEVGGQMLERETEYVPKPTPLHSTPLFLSC